MAEDERRTSAPNGPFCWAVSTMTNAVPRDHGAGNLEAPAERGRGGVELQDRVQKLEAEMVSLSRQPVPLLTKKPTKTRARRTNHT
jgi:hypothetical protein